MPDLTEEQQEELYLKVKRILFDNYEPVDKIQDGISMTTAEIYQRLQDHVPSGIYTTSNVAAWLVEGGYKTYTVGQLKMGWLLKKRKHGS